MAIRGHAYWGHTTGSYFADASLAGYGPGTPVVLINPANASGKAGDVKNLVGPSTGGAGEIFVGILNSTVYNWDKTQCCFHPEQFKSASTACTPVNVVQDFEGCVDSGSTTLAGTPSAGDSLFLGPSGTFSDAGAVNVGTFQGAPNSDGHVSIRVHR